MYTDLVTGWQSETCAAGEVTSEISVSHYTDTQTDTCMQIHVHALSLSHTHTWTHTQTHTHACTHTHTPGVDQGFCEALFTLEQTMNPECFGLGFICRKTHTQGT